jgi:hypothetical protein
LGTKENWKKIFLSHAPKLKREKQGTLSACWGFTLGAWKFCSRNCLSPFSTLTNTLIVNWEYLWFIQLRGCTQHQICKSLLYFLFPFHFSFYSSRLSNFCCKAPIRYLLSSFLIPGGQGEPEPKLVAWLFLLFKIKPMERIHCKEYTRKREARRGIPYWSIRITSVPPLGSW